MTRPDLSNRTIFATVVVGGLAVIAYFAIKPALPQAWQVPGTPPLYVAGVVGSLLLLVPAAFALAKRGGLTESPNTWFVAHVVAAVGGAVLIAVHSAGALSRPPALMLLGILFLVYQGAWARTALSRTVSASFGRRLDGFAPPDPAIRERLGGLIAEKTALLGCLDAGANEGTFSLTPLHWLKHPTLSWRYRRLAASERAALGLGGRLPLAQAYWRLAHILVAWALVVGLFVHIVVVTFFAGYATEGREIYWWHVSD